MRRKIKNLINILLKGYFSFPFFVINKMGGKGNYLFSFFCDAYQKNNKEYCLIDLRPKYSEDVSDNILKVDTNTDELAIVIQGPIKGDFIIDTVKIYKKIFTKSLIIISTWNDVEDTLLDKLNELGVEIVLSELPEVCGFSNVNYQIVSSMAGIKRAKEMNATYVMKTRSDQRIYNPLSFEYLKSLLELFPVESQIVTQEKRIITVGGFKNQVRMPYFLQDFFYFGLIDDVYRLFDIPLDNRNYHRRKEYMDENNIETMTNYDVCKIEIPEIYIVKSYLRKTQRVVLEDSVEASWRYIRDLFFIIDRADLKLFWNKYESFKEYSNSVFYDGNKTIACDEGAWGTAFSMSLLMHHIFFEQELNKEIDIR